MTSLKGTTKLATAEKSQLHLSLPCSRSFVSKQNNGALLDTAVDTHRTDGFSRTILLEWTIATAVLVTVTGWYRTKCPMHCEYY
jgi:hypothetical protein